MMLKLPPPSLTKSFLVSTVTVGLNGRVNLFICFGYRSALPCRLTALCKYTQCCRGENTCNQYNCRAPFFHADLVMCPFIQRCKPQLPALLEIGEQRRDWWEGWGVQLVHLHSAVNLSLFQLSGINRAKGVAIQL